MKELLIFLLLLLFIENIFSISCSGGRVVGGVCKCPTGYIYSDGKCSKQSVVKCKGGKVIDNICSCPSATRLERGICKKV